MREKSRQHSSPIRRVRAASDRIDDIHSVEIQCLKQLAHPLPLFAIHILEQEEREKSKNGA